MRTLQIVKTDIMYFDSHNFKDEHSWNHMWQFSFHPRSIQSVDENIISLYLRDSTFYAWRFIVKHAIMKNIDFKSMYMEDVATTPSILAACKNFWYEPISIVNYRIRPASIMTTWNPKKIADMIIAPAITQSSLRSIMHDSKLINNENKILGLRFFYWAIKDSRMLNSDIDKEFYLKIKSLYIENFGKFNFKSDFPLLTNIYKPDEWIKWLLLYNNWYLFTKLVTKAGNFKYKALRRKIWKNLIIFIKIVTPLLILLLFLLNFYLIYLVVN